MQLEARAKLLQAQFASEMKRIASGSNLTPANLGRIIHRDERAVIAHLDGTVLFDRPIAARVLAFFGCRKGEREDILQILDRLVACRAELERLLPAVTDDATV